MLDIASTLRAVISDVERAVLSWISVKEDCECFTKVAAVFSDMSIPLPKPRPLRKDQKGFDNETSLVSRAISAGDSAGTLDAVVSFFIVITLVGLKLNFGRKNNNFNIKFKNYL